MMTVRVLLFASYADAIGSSSLDLDLPEASRVEDLVAAVQRLTHNALPAAPLVAVNSEYAARDQVVRGGDEVAIIPPVAGG